MKKFLLMVACGFFAYAGTAQAQDESANFWFGPKIGVDLAQPTVDEAAIKSQIKSNFQAGFFLQFGRKFYFQPEFYYATQTEKITSASATIEEKVNSIRVPLMLGMRVVNLKVISAHIMAGPSGSWMLGSAKSSNNISRQQQSFSLQGGGGVDLIGLFTLDVRYAVDLDDNTSAQLKQLSWNSGVNVTLGIKLR